MTITNKIVVKHITVLHHNPEGTVVKLTITNGEKSRERRWGSSKEVWTYRRQVNGKVRDVEQYSYWDLVRATEYLRGIVRNSFIEGYHVTESTLFTGTDIENMRDEVAAETTAKKEKKEREEREYKEKAHAEHIEKMHNEALAWERVLVVRRGLDNHIGMFSAAYILDVVESIGTGTGFHFCGELPGLVQFMTAKAKGYELPRPTASSVHTCQDWWFNRAFPNTYRCVACTDKVLEDKLSGSAGMNSIDLAVKTMNAEQEAK